MASRPGAVSARDAALRVIRRVTEQGAYSNLALAGELTASNLDERDRRFATDLSYGTLRRLLVLDDAIAPLVSRPIDRVDPETRGLLRLGAYQILFTRVPAHAAVSETVAAAPKRAKGFVNAVLRRLAAAPDVVWPVGDGNDAIAGRTGMRGWVVAELRHVLPRDEVDAAASGLATPAPLTLRTNLARIRTDGLIGALRDAGYDVTQGRFNPDVVSVPSATPADLPGYAEGWFAVQDEASAVVGDAVGALEGERILDACAGPGGKAADLACRVGPDGLVVAGDVVPARAVLVRRTVERLGLRVPALVQDARYPALQAGSFDAVLVDAPCSGLGAARRRPELLWRVPEDRLRPLARLQLEILIAVAELVRPGGRLVYSVCTFPRLETDETVRAFLDARRDFEPADVPGPDGSAPAHRLWPHRHGTDGMFYAGLRRRGTG